jgi:UDP-arabinose 4-epimerase
MVTVLLTGGAGYVGSHTAKAIARAGYRPVVFDNCSTGNRAAVKWGPLVVGDLKNGRLVRDTIRRYGVSVVVHFAAHAHVSESMAQPLRYFRNNIGNTLSLLEAQYSLGVKYFVFSSSCATYGIPNELPITDSHPQCPVSPYGESKLCVERVLRWCGECYGLRWVALRYFNAAGADPDGEIGESHTPETHLVPRIIEAARKKTPEFTIYGNDYATPDGTAVRDYVHVTDLADAHLRAIEYLREGGDSRALNLGTGRGYSVREVIASVEQLTDKMIRTLKCARRNGDPPILVADCSGAAEALGWSPVHSDLKEIVGTAWRWHSLCPAIKI